MQITIEKTPEAKSSVFEPPLLTSEQAAKALGVSVFTLRRRGEIFGIKTGNKLLYSVDMLRIRQRVFERGILIADIPRGPGLPNDGTLRISVFATHTTEILDHLVEQLVAVL